MAHTSDSIPAVDITELPGMSDLYADYVAWKPEIARFFPSKYRTPDDWQIAVRRASERPMDRETLVGTLLEQNQRWEMPPEVIDNIERLRDPASVAIVTGQQLGAFGGPLYTVYKTLTAIKLARAVEEHTGTPVIPVFWVEGEDHDFDEIAGIHLLSRNDIESVTIDRPSAGPQHGAVGRMVFGDEIATAIDRIDEILAPSDFHDELVDTLRRSYTAGRSLEDSFVALWKELFARFGLVFLNPDDAGFKTMVRPLFERDLTDGDRAVDAVMQAGEELKSKYHQQVTARPTNLFYLEDDARRAIDRDGDRFSIRGGGQHWSREEVVAELEARPERFSPNVVTRPLMQDALLPTAFYVAGPGEIAYFAQYRALYEWAEIPMPGIFPRLSATLVEPKVGKVFGRMDLSLEMLARGVEHVFAEKVRQAEGNGASTAFDAFRSELNAGLSKLKPEVESVDQSLGRSVEAARAGMMKELDRLSERVFRAQKRQHDEMRGQIEKASINVLPHGKLQERALSPLYYLNKFGPALIDRLYDSLDVESFGHQIVEL
jgi:bacillithiol synthase